MTSERPIPLGLALALILPAMGCGGVTVEGGIAVDLFISHAPQGPVTVSDTARAFTTAEGLPVRLVGAWVTVYGMELLPCPESFATASRPSHGETSPTRLGNPLIEDALGPDDAPWLAGTLEPPPGRWCTLRVVLEPADVDAQGLPGEVELVGHTAWIEGQIEGDGSGSGPFSFGTDGVRWVDLPLGDGGMELSEDDPLATVDVRFAYDRFLDGVTPPPLGEASGAEADSLMSAVAAALSLTVQRP